MLYFPETKKILTLLLNPDIDPRPVVLRGMTNVLRVAIVHLRPADGAQPTDHAPGPGRAVLHGSPALLPGPGVHQGVEPGCRPVKEMQGNKLGTF